MIARTYCEGVCTFRIRVVRLFAPPAPPGEVEANVSEYELVWLALIVLVEVEMIPVSLPMSESRYQSHEAGVVWQLVPEVASAYSNAMFMIESVEEPVSCTSRVAALIPVGFPAT